MVRTGLEALADKTPDALKKARLGLLCNPASLTRTFEPAPELVQRVSDNALTCLFSPQHGFFAEKQDNMVESDHSVHPRLGLKVYSLYGEHRAPQSHMLENLDILLVDLWDVGCRVYTFFNTVLACMKQAARQGVAVWILDRPNPLGRGEEGPILPKDLASFVGPHPMPLRHGLTMGELGELVAFELKLDLDLKVIPLEGWQGEDFATTGQPWVMPSPNLPSFSSARVYPGQVLLEGVSLSEGRGTTRPFELFGAPGLDPWAVSEAVEKEALSGAFLRPVFFQPTFHKYQGEVCGGFQLQVTDPDRFKTLRASLAVLSAINRVHPGLCTLRQPPYEYEYEKRPLDLILGDRRAVDLLQKGTPALELEQAWQSGLADWLSRTEPFLMY
ncbi:hypothetical protein X474_07585 [Dethiosulfatarculus sandiegensis]|uniref:DUF1343 domain-containing protein n=1 Tax=Dethiosulfatarculus sandiegensis TaxID=1429043 RepID=A0A0D2J8J5_9BACT|nr:hypothetical protein X474_07585 [Dethiosulfatarculus sandiegensis]